MEDTMTKGRFCFNHPTVFSKWEDTGAAQFDRWEAHDAYECIHLVVAPIIGEEKGMPVYGPGKKWADKAIIHTQSDTAKHSPICCFRCVTRDEFEFKDNQMIYSLGQTAERIMQEFGHDAYVMIHLDSFLKRLEAKVGSYLAGNVAYHDLLNDFQFNVSEENEEIVEQLFRKDKRFEWQKEYRIALRPNNKSPVFVEVGSIEDIAACGDIIDLKD